MKTQQITGSSLITAVLLTAVAFGSQAQTEPTTSQPGSDWKNEKRVALLFGLSQPILGRGFNVEGNLFYKRLVFDYSHGVSLDIRAANAGTELKGQHLAVHIPWTTGFGVGYRVTKLLNVRVEPKWHRYEIYNDGDVQTASSRITGYTTFTLGAGAYLNWRPFEKANNALSGILIAPSVRYWPRISSSLPGDKLAYQNRTTGEQATHKAMEIGFNNTPVFVNVSIGYSLDFQKKQ